MNKKFSTLVASLLLASSVGAYAQQVVSLTADQLSVDVEAVAQYSSDTKTGGYEQGKSYLLQVAPSVYLSGKGNALTLEEVSSISKLSDLDNILWTLQQLKAPAGAAVPEYVFVNKTTGALLAMDATKAVAWDGDNTNFSDGSNALTGETYSWMGSPSYKNPSPATLYSSVAGDNVVAMVAASLNGGENVYLAKMKRSDYQNTTTATVQFVKVTPYTLKSSANQDRFVLSPNDLNTLLGKAGSEATKDSYFQLSFDPTATVKGEDNLWEQDLQAVAVEQYSQKYETKADEEGSVVRGSYINGTATAFETGAYASLQVEKELKAKDIILATSKYADYTASTEVGYKNANPVWVALRNKDGKYLVADTISISGTAQDANARMSFKFDDLYDAQGGTRFRDPRSYLFQFEYNPIDNTVRIKNQAYISAAAVTPVGASDAKEVISEDGYISAAVKTGQTMYAASNVTEKAYIIRAALGATSEVTLQKPAGAYPTTSADIFTITLGNSAAYTPGYVKSGAYLLKVTGSKDEKKIGKYWVANMKGGFEIMEEAVRQNFQEMPAAQWIVKSAGTGMGSPITIANREFNSATAASMTTQQVTSAGMVYVGGANNEFFFMNGDTLQFIPVENPADKYLGYKYVANDTIAESTFTFNYLHDLAMNKPINTTNDKDSVVWVDRNGESTSFILERVIDDNYGTNGGLTGVANLVRSVYNIKVNDATKLQNDKRYLAYDAQLKKYVVSTDKKDNFFLKENNEDGACYYTLVPASVESFVEFKDGSWNKVFDRPTLVTDTDVHESMIVGEEGKVVNPLTGLAEDGIVVKQFATEAEAKAYIAGREAFMEVREVGNGSFTTVSSGKYADLNQPGARADNAATIKAGKFIVKAQYSFSEANYAIYKVSVDNNTLNLVNGVLNDNSANEVATSAFAVTRDANMLYRRFNTELEGEANDAPKTLKFYRVNGAAPEYLFEDANSKYSAELGVNFLGIEGKGDAKNAAMYVDTAYVRNNTRMPQYMLVMNPTFVEADTVLCDASTHSHATKEEALACEHSKVTKGYVEGRYLINLQDSVDVEESPLRPEYANKYQWNDHYTRLAFVEARHIDDTLVIKNSVVTGIEEPIEVGKPATYASMDSIYLGNNLHKNVVFSFRYVKSGSNDFLIESETSKVEKGVEKHVKNSELEAVKIAPNEGGWIKIQNGVPVIANVSYKEAALEAEIFNVEKTDEDPTANEAVEASEVSVVATQGAIIVKGAAGKVVTVSNVLGQTIANQVAASDNVTIAAPAGIAVVAVDGEAVKVVVK